MTYSLNYEGFERYLTSIDFDDCRGTRTYVFRFDNGYGALVTDYSDPKWEVTVINYYEDLSNNYFMDFSTDVTDDIIVDASNDDVLNILNQIKEL